MKLVIFLLGAFSLFCFASGQMVGEKQSKKAGYFLRKNLFTAVARAPFVILFVALSQIIDHHYGFGAFDGGSSGFTHMLKMLLIAISAWVLLMPLFVSVVYFQRRVLGQRGPTEKYRRLVSLDRLYGWIGFASGSLCLGLSLWGLG